MIDAETKKEGMMIDREGCVIGIAACLVFIACIFVIGLNVGTGAMQNEAIRRGFAEYSQQTGAWQWRDTKAEKASE